jgi:hypothetical protein
MSSNHPLKTSSAIPSINDRFYQAAQSDDFFVLFQQHRQQKNFERQGMPGIGCCCQVLPGSSKQIIQCDLVSASQGSAETRKRAFLFNKDLGN